MHVDAEPIECVFVVGAIAAETFEQQVAVGMQQDLVGVRRDQILALAHRVRHRDDVLAGGFEAVDRRADFVQRRHAGRAHFVRFDDQAFDALVGGCGVDRLDDVAQLHFLDSLSEHAGERALHRVGAVLLDDAALRVQHEGRAFLQRGSAAAASAQRDEEAEQQNHRDHAEHEPAHESEQAPSPEEQGGEHAAAFLCHMILENALVKLAVQSARGPNGFPNCITLAAYLNCRSRAYALSHAARGLLARRKRRVSNTAAAVRPAIKPIHMPRALSPCLNASQ